MSSGCRLSVEVPISNTTPAQPGRIRLELNPEAFIDTYQEAIILYVISRYHHRYLPSIQVPKRLIEPASLYPGLETSGSQSSGSQVL